MTDLNNIVNVKTFLFLEVLLLAANVLQTVPGTTLYTLISNLLDSS